MDELMQVRSGARELGVSESTLARWAERGLLCAVKPLSGGRRFRGQDIAVLQAQMVSGFPSPGQEEDVVPVWSARAVD